MAPHDDKSQRAIECFTFVKRTFVITFLLVFITTAIMYGTTQTMSIQTSRVIQSNFKPMPMINRNFTNTVTRRDPIVNSANISDDALDNTHEYQKTFLEVSEKRASFIKEPRPARVDTPSSSMIMKLDESLKLNLPAKLTSLVKLRPGVVESSEFPGMPDPCQTPRRNTGVEDVLCMVGTLIL